jgi:glycosyltransferase involved in cell wall biosynthesis
MARARPVIGTAVGGIPEMIEDGVTGLLVPPADPVALAAALQRLLGDGTLRARLGTAARNRASQRFTPDAQITALARLVTESQ